MSGETLLTALGLVLIIEGVLPFVAPSVWRDAFRRITQLNDGQLRFVGLSCMIGGLLFLWWGGL